ncbi:MAG TPA: phosphoribosylglycinamide synthetase [Novosphingobium sp.]|nr:phosphoribosylglycinamide synthetase [Novosphingobium sp.]
MPASASDLVKLRLSPADRQRLKILFIAKHALADGGRDPVDGDHAVYHRHVRDTLEGLGLNLIVANSFDVLNTRPDADFVFSLLNRGGFFNSEMLAPLLCSRLGIPYLGARPILRGLSDDKHLMKMAARARRVPTADSAICRFGQGIPEAAPFAAARYVSKPNNSSASWGVNVARTWDEVRGQIAAIHAEGHDALVEPFMRGIDLELPVIGGPEAEQFLPLMRFTFDPDALRTYAHKRGFEKSDARLEQELDESVIAKVAQYTRALLPELSPFDYGRFEYRLDAETGEIRFLEVNLQCNIWAPRVIGTSAGLAGFTYPELLETIIASSLMRQGLLEQEPERIPAHG